jgi:hypothetical protein
VLHNLNSSSIKCVQIKEYEMGGRDHVARMVKMRNTYKVPRKPKWKRPLGGRNKGGRVMLKSILKNCDVRMWAGFI